MEACRRPRSLILQDGSIFHGYSFGSEMESTGEIVFQTGMVGYPESLTDPSYCRQTVISTYPFTGLQKMGYNYLQQVELQTPTSLVDYRDPNLTALIETTIAYYGPKFYVADVDVYGFVTVVCNYGGHSTMGYGYTEAAAKEAATAQMLVKIRTQGHQPLPLPMDPNLAELIETTIAYYGPKFYTADVDVYGFVTVVCNYGGHSTTGYGYTERAGKKDATAHMFTKIRTEGHQPLPLPM